VTFPALRCCGAAPRSHSWKRPAHSTPPTAVEPAATCRSPTTEPEACASRAAAPSRTARPAQGGPPAADLPAADRRRARRSRTGLRPSRPRRPAVGGTRPDRPARLGHRCRARLPRRTSPVDRHPRQRHAPPGRCPRWTRDRDHRRWSRPPRRRGPPAGLRCRPDSRGPQQPRRGPRRRPYPTPGHHRALAGPDRPRPALHLPGCTRPPVRCHAHHIRHWADHGETAPDNLAMLCGHHHRVIRQSPWQIRINRKDRKPEFSAPPRHGEPRRWIRYRPRHDH
jgi:HNH endonuclease